jgi:chromate reductase
MDLLTLSGSLRTDSINTRLLSVIEALARGDGHRVDRFDRMATLPPFNEDDEERPAPAVAHIRERLLAADAVVIATPEYSGSIPGHLKNLLDWAARPHASCAFLNVPVAVVSASPGSYGAAWGREHTEHVLGRMGARVLPTRFGLARVDAGMEGDLRIDEADRDRLRASLRDLAALSQHVPVS